MRQRKGNSVGDRLLMILVGLFLYAPIIILIVFSFNAGNSSSVWKGFSLHWYAELLNDRLIMHSVYTTLLVSLLATVIATVAGTFAAIGFYGMRRRARTGLMAVNNIPMMNADIVTGVSLCLLFVVFFNGWHSFAVWVNGWQSLVVLPERLTLGFGTLLIAHICFNIPYVILSVGPKLRQMDRNLVDAAQDLGCTWMQAFWKVIIPEIKPGIVSGALTAFTMSIDDFIISYFTAGTSSSTLAMTIYGMTKKRVSPEINAVSTLLFVTVIILLAIINLRENHAEHHRNVHHESATFAPAPKKYSGLGKKIAAGAMACVLLAVLIVTGAAARSERVVNVCSWGEYIDESLITEFEEKTGIRVNYQTAESNEALYSLIKMGGADFDVIVPSDYMIARLIQEDMLYLQNFEKRLATIEESLLDTLPKELQRTLITIRRELLVFHAYYQQLLDMCEILSEDENHFLPPECARQFSRLGNRVDRLYDHTQMLREYALQIREMQQAQIDLRQNDTMRILTVVSTIFFPLSLIAGWYGMNFTHMPELSAPYAYFILIGVCILIVAVEIWYFKKKGWF